MKAAIAIIIVIIIAAVAIVISRNDIKTENVSLATPQATSVAQFSPYTATFEIYTNGTKRTFTDSRYHELSTEVFITANNPQTINIHKQGITWNDFFKTLPMKLSKDCLITGTNQTFCSSETSILKFFINENEDADALDREIMPNDHLEVIYSPSS